MYLFFIREFNDIDHITPIVWKMGRDCHPVAVYCLNPEYDLKNDYRLQFLKRSGTTVGFVFDEWGRALGMSHRIIRLIGRTCFAIVNRLDRRRRPSTAGVLAALHRFAQKTGKRCFNLSRSKFYTVSWARHILEASGAAALCFDHINPDRYIVEIFLEAAAEKSIPTIALPHGVFIYTNSFVRVGSDEEDRYDKFNRFHRVVTQNDLRREVLARAGVDPEKIFVLGSARYCDEWMAQNRKILPRVLKPDELRGGRLKAVFMTTRFVYRIDVARMLKTFDLLAGLPGVETVVKPHTRSGREAEVYETIPLANAAEFSSVELCEWADVVLAIGSSIIIEPLKQGKPVLYLKYLHENTTQYEELGACWTIRDEEELKNAMLALRDDITNVPYTREHAERFLSEIIYGGQAERDVLKDYETFIVKSAGKRNRGA